MLILSFMYFSDNSVQKLSKLSHQELEIPYVFGESWMLTRRVPGSEALGATKRVSVLTSVSQKVESKCGSAGLLSLSPMNVYVRLVKKLALKSDVILENFKPGSEYRSLDIRERLRLNGLSP
jgi:hypothetical protein